MAEKKTKKTMTVRRMIATRSKRKDEVAGKGAMQATVDEVEPAAEVALDPDAVSPPATRDFTKEAGFCQACGSLVMAGTCEHGVSPTTIPGEQEMLAEVAAEETAAEPTRNALGGVTSPHMDAQLDASAAQEAASAAQEPPPAATTPEPAAPPAEAAPAPEEPSAKVVPLKGRKKKIAPETKGDPATETAEERTFLDKVARDAIAQGAQPPVEFSGSTLGAAVSAAEPTPAVRVRQLISLDRIQEHPDNPRLVYPRIEDLAKDIGEHGLREPIKVREVGPGAYQVISGHRRLRAIRSLGWTETIADVLNLTDEEAYQRLVVENEHREDLTAIEEGLAFAGLLQRGQTVEQVASLIGKSVAHVYARMKLVSLCEAGRQAMIAGWLTPETALLVARIPTPELQEQALVEIGPTKDADAMSYREAQRHVQTRYMLLLSKAPFDRKDEELCPGVGACSACPKRSGALPAEIRTDLKGADICLDRDCYGKKVDASWAIHKAAAAEKGIETVDAKEAAERVLVHVGDEVATHNGFTSLEDVVWEDEKQRSWSKLLGKKDLPAPDVIIQSPHTGKPLPAWRRGRLVEIAAERKLIKARSDRAAPSEADAALRKKIREQRKVAGVAIERLLLKQPAIGKWPVDLWRAIVNQCLEFQWGNVIAKRMGLGDEKDNPFHTLCGKVDRMSVEECQNLVLHALLQQMTEYSYHPHMTGGDKALRAILAAFGLDLKEISAEVKAGPAPEARKEEEPEPKKKAGPKGPLARKVRK